MQGALDTVRTVRARADRARLGHSRLIGLRAAAQARADELARKVGEAKGRLALGDEVQAVLEASQRRAHERSMGLFERLLSAFVADVLPDKGGVRLALATERGQPALDIFVEKDGNSEDILEGNGGALTNVVCAGLRFAALARTGNRKLMVLDEPDCWVKPERVPAFVKVLAEVAHDVQVQTFLISHHDKSFFEDYATVVGLTEHNGVVHAQVQSPEPAVWADPRQPGIRSIRLVNFRSHADTLVPCFPGITAVVGDNNLGKSTAISSSLKAVAYGESDDSVIRHGADEARIVIELEEGKRLEWLRKRKGSPKVLYSLWQGESLLHEGRPATRGSVPDWVSAELGINRADELDIQIGGQKSPVFLLNEAPSRRAQLLSVGRESGFLHALIERYGDLKRTDREVSRDGEAELMRLRWQLERSGTLAAIGERIEALLPRLAVVEDAARLRDRLAGILGRMNSARTAGARAEREIRALSALPAQAPALHDQKRLVALGAQVRQATRRAAVKAEFEPLAWPGLNDNTALTALIARMHTAAKRMQAGARLPALAPRLPELAALEPLSKAIARQAQAAKDCARTQTALAHAVREEAAAEASLTALKAKLGHCPLCGSSFASSHTH